MNIIKNMPIGRRLGAAFAFVVVLLGAVATVGMTGIRSVSQDMNELVHEHYAKVSLVSNIEESFNQQATSLRNIVIVTDEKDLKAELALIEESGRQISAGIEKLTAGIKTQTGKDLLRAAADARVKFVDVRGQLIKLVAAGQIPEARKYLTENLRPVQIAYYNALEKLNERQVARMEESAAEAAADARHASFLMMGLSATAALLAVALGLLISRSITRPINEAVRIAQTVASGDLTSRIEVSSTDETGKLLAALKAMNDSLVSVVTTVRQGSDSIATGSSQIATGNADLSQRTEEQASNLQQTAASMEQLTSTVKNNAETARQATELAGSASTVAAQGGTVVGQVVTTMEAITASSKKISDIISVIDGIAFQTNILALNAAVEAARAGEQGRGFAVVASEVRSLAQRSADAARQIKELITDSVQKVETGSQQVSEAGRTMSDIVDQVRRVNELISEISSATREQTQGISQVGDAVNQLDQVTQQNAARVEESAAAADSLNQQAARLVEAVSVFNLGQGQVQVQASQVIAQAKATSRVAVKPAARAAAPSRPQPAKASKSTTAASATPVAAQDGWDKF